MGMFDKMKRQVAATGGAAERPAVKLAAAPAPPDPRTVGVTRSDAVVRLIEVDRIEPDPDQPRKTFSDDSIGEMAASLNARGQQTAIIVYWHGTSGKYRILVGERRWRGARAAGWSTIECKVLDSAPDRGRALAHQIVENDQREDLPPMERARSYADAMEANGWTMAQLCAETGLRMPRVSKALALLKLSPVVQDLVESGELDWSLAYDLRHLDAIGQGQVAGLAVEGGWTGADLRAAVDARLGRDRVPIPGQEGLPIAADPPPAQAPPVAQAPAPATVGGLSAGNSPDVPDEREDDQWTPPPDPPTPAQDLRREIRKAAESIASVGTPAEPHPIDAHLDRVKRKAAEGTLAPGTIGVDPAPLAGWEGPEAWGDTTHFDYEPGADSGGMTVVMAPGSGYADLVQLLKRAWDAAKWRAALEAVRPDGARPGDLVEPLDTGDDNRGRAGRIEDRPGDLIWVRFDRPDTEVGAQVVCYRGEKLRRAGPAPES